MRTIICGLSIVWYAAACLLEKYSELRSATTAPLPLQPFIAASQLLRTMLGSPFLLHRLGLKYDMNHNGGTNHDGGTVLSHILVR